jgi:hypothetical protein
VAGEPDDLDAQRRERRIALEVAFAIGRRGVSVASVQLEVRAGARPE